MRYAMRKGSSNRRKSAVFALHTRIRADTRAHKGNGRLNHSDAAPSLAKSKFTRFHQIFRDFGISTDFQGSTDFHVTVIYVQFSPTIFSRWRKSTTFYIFYIFYIFSAYDENGGKLHTGKSTETLRETINICKNM